MLPKPRGSDDEILLLITVRRRQAKRCVANIVARFAQRRWPVPPIELLIDYYASMFQCLELMLKLLSGDWRSHNVAKMYREVFGSPHPHGDLMRCIQEGMKNQKYLFEPSDPVLSDLIPDIEELFFELKSRISEKYRRYRVKKEVVISNRSVEYLQNYAGGFYKREARPGETFDEAVRAWEAELEKIATNMGEYCRNKGGVDFHCDLVWSTLGDL